MYFIFENECKSTEALVTALKYDDNKSMYELTVCGIDKDGLNYTQSGKAWFNSEELKELTDSKKLESERQLIGRRLRFISDKYS